MKEKISLVNLSEKQQNEVKAGAQPLLCSVCGYYVFFAGVWVRECGWDGLPGAGCPFNSGA